MRRRRLPRRDLGALRDAGGEEITDLKKLDIGQ